MGATLKRAGDSGHLVQGEREGARRGFHLYDHRSAQRFLRPTNPKCLDASFLRGKF